MVKKIKKSLARIQEREAVQLTERRAELAATLKGEQEVVASDLSDLLNTDEGQSHHAHEHAATALKVSQAEAAAALKLSQAADAKLLKQSQQSHAQELKEKNQVISWVLGGYSVDTNQEK